MNPLLLAVTTEASKQGGLEKQEAATQRVCSFTSPICGPDIHEVVRLLVYTGVLFAGHAVVDAAQPVAALGPALVADAGVAPEHVVGVDGALDGQQALVVIAPEAALPVGLAAVVLRPRVLVRGVKRTHPLTRGLL